jgi:chromosome segregation ATPase
MLILEHPIRNDWKLAADLAPEEQSATAYRFRIAVPSKQTKTFTVDETRPIITQYALTNLTLDQIEAFSTERELTPEIESSLRQIIAQKDAISKLDADLQSKQADVDRIFQDQERLRENMKALKGTPEEKALAQRYTGELNDQEMRLATLRTEISNLETAQKQAQQDLDAMIEKLTFDANL